MLCANVGERAGGGGAGNFPLLAAVAPPLSFRTGRAGLSAPPGSSPLPPARLCGWAGLAAATAPYGRTSWAGRASMAYEEEVFIPATIILCRNEAAFLILEQNIQVVDTEGCNSSFIAACSISDYFLFSHFTRACPLCVCLCGSLWLPWRLCYNEMMNSCFQGAAIMNTPPAVYPNQGCLDACRKGYRGDTTGGRRDGDKENDVRPGCTSFFWEVSCQVKM